MSKSQAVFRSPAPETANPNGDSGRVVAAAPVLQPPALLGRYALFGRIGAGGMGVVHLGRLLGSAGFERAVAIKRVHPLLATDQHFIAMFRDELRLLSRVRHQHVISALDVVEVEGELLLVMEYVHGESLAALLQRTASSGTPIPVEVAVTIACGVLRGLHAAHTATSAAGEALGIIHRDVSPHNVQVGCDGLARIVDFGVAKSASSPKVTQVGQLRGKPGYVAPEQILGEPASHRSDIYALSVVLWEMLAGQRLFAGKSVAETIERVASGDVPRLSTVAPRSIPSRLEAVVHRGLGREPASRFATARDMAVALEAASRLVPCEKLGEWVSETAGAPLRERARQLWWAETCTIGEQASAIVEDSETTLVRSLEVVGESATRDFPLEALAPVAEGPGGEPAPQVVVTSRAGKRKLVVAIAAVLAVSLLGARVYRTASANAEEAVRSRAAVAMAQAGLRPVEPAPSQRSPATTELPVIVPEDLPSPADSLRSVSPVTASVMPRSASTPGGRKPVTKSAAAIPSQVVSVDGF